jgi:putative transport protein
MERIIDLFVEQPLLLLFVVAALGYLLGEIRIKGTGLGVAAVLFVGLFFGALDPRLTLPPIIVTLGLVLFVYTVGLASGPGFVASFSRSGIRDNLLVVFVLLAAAALVTAEHFLFGFKPTISAGIFTGALTNTPSLAQVISYISHTAPADVVQTAMAEPVVGYSVSYPMGVIGPMLAIVLMQRLWRVDYRADAERVRDMFPVEQEIYNRTVRITNRAMTGIKLSELAQQHDWKIIFGRTKRGNTIELMTGESVMQPGDLVSVIGTPEDVDAVARQLGEPAAEQLDLDRRAYDFRRVFVSNIGLVGRRLSELDLPQRYGAIVTRVRRGDIELLATADLVLELGDRVRFVAPRDQVKPLSDFFGDSYKALSEINLLSLGLGISLGLLVGMIPIDLPGGIQFKLGEAGGPLIVALVLSALRRTGPIVWSLPYSVNLTLRQLGLTILLAGIGIRSGYTFLSTLTNAGGLQILLAGAVVSVTTALLVLILAHKVLKIPFGIVTGMVSAVHTQPAVQAYAVNQARNDLPNHGYALAFPMSTIAKILLAQLLVALLPGGG